MEPNNSGGSNKVLTTVLVVAVVGVVGYLIYKAGKGTAASAANNGTSPLYNGTNIPTATHAPSTRTTTGTTAGNNNVAAVTGLLSNVLSLFKKKGTTATKAPVRAGGSGGGIAGGVISGGIGANTNNTDKGTRDNNNWDGQGGYIIVYADGGADLYYSDGTYADSDPVGTWGPPANSGTSASGETRFDNNWDGQGGYMIVYPDGGADYYESDGTYWDSDPVGTWE